MNIKSGTLPTEPDDIDSISEQNEHEIDALLEQFDELNNLDKPINLEPTH